MQRTTGFRALMMVLAIALVAGTLGPPAATRAQVPPPPGLGGERLATDDPATIVVTNALCNDAGTSTFTYQVSGVATGPYAGTFTESGTVTLGPLTPSFSKDILALTATFSIDSPAGQVTGSKELVPGPNADTGVCQERFVPPPRTNATARDLRFTATIVPPDGRTCTAVGSSTLSLLKNNSTLADSFSETFLNDVVDGLPVSPTCTGGEEPPPPVPTSKEQCRAGGFAAFGFKNQGDCIAFVEHSTKGKVKKEKKAHKHHKGHKQHKGDKGKSHHKKAGRR